MKVNGPRSAGPQSAGPQSAGPQSRRRLTQRVGLWLLIAGLILAGLGLGATRYTQQGAWPRWALARAHQAGSPHSARWYALIERRHPALQPYTRLWGAVDALPAMDAVLALHDLTTTLPDGPVALEAHVALARYYASIESPQTVTHYQAALELDDRPDIRLELAQYLEAQHAPAGAYGHYLQLLGSDRADAFVGARRTAPSVTILARDLLERGYASDVVDVLYRVGDCEAYCLRGDALRRLGRVAEADATDAMCAACSPAAAAADDEAGTAPAPVPAAAGPATPLELWNRSWELEEAADHAALLPLYLELAGMESLYADDAAYRAWVLARRLSDGAAESQARRALAATQPGWLAYRASGELPLCLLPDYPPAALEELTAAVMARVVALDELGLAEPAHQELRLAALVSETPEVIQRLAQELLARGYTTEAWSLAAALLRRDPCAPRAVWELAYPRPYADTVWAAAGVNSLSPGLLWAVMRQESAYQPEVMSGAGARGLMQIMPFTQQGQCEAGQAPCPPGASFVPEDNIRMGATHLRAYSDYYEGDLELAVLAYNAGPGNVDEWLQDPNVADRDDLLRLAWFGETREYLERVMLDALVYQALYGE